MSGRPRVKISQEAVQHFRNRGMSWRQISKSLGVGYGTVRRIYHERAKSEPKPCRENFRDCILRILKERGPEGITSIELNFVCLRYGARIYELRKRGWEIETRKESEDRFRFVLIGRTADFSTVSTNFPKDMGT